MEKNEISLDDSNPDHSPVSCPLLNYGGRRNRLRRRTDNNHGLISCEKIKIKDTGLQRMNEYKPKSNLVSRPVIKKICLENQFADLLKPINENVKYKTKLEDIQKNLDNDEIKSSQKNRFFNELNYDFNVDNKENVNTIGTFRQFFDDKNIKPKYEDINIEDECVLPVYISKTDCVTPSDKGESIKKANTDDVNEDRYKKLWNDFDIDKIMDCNGYINLNRLFRMPLCKPSKISKNSSIESEHSFGNHALPIVDELFTSFEEQPNCDKNQFIGEKDRFWFPRPDCNFFPEHCCERENNGSCNYSSQQPSEHIEIDIPFHPKTESAFILPSEVTEQTSENLLHAEKYQFQYPSQDCVRDTGTGLPNADTTDPQVLQPCQDSVRQFENYPLNMDKSKFTFQNSHQESIQQAENSNGEFQSQHPSQNFIKCDNNPLSTEENSFQFQRPCLDFVQLAENNPLNTDENEFHIEHLCQGYTQESENTAENNLQFQHLCQDSVQQFSTKQSNTDKKEQLSASELIESLGSSTVYKVLSPNMNKTLAIEKVNLTGLDSSVADGYFDEVEMLKSFQGCENVKMFARKKQNGMLLVDSDQDDSSVSCPLLNYRRKKMAEENGMWLVDSNTDVSPVSCPLINYKGRRNRLRRRTDVHDSVSCEKIKSQRMNDYKPKSNDVSSSALKKICLENKFDDLLKPMNENMKYETSYNQLEDIWRHKDHEVIKSGIKNKFFKELNYDFSIHNKENVNTIDTFRQFCDEKNIKPKYEDICIEQSIPPLCKDECILPVDYVTPSSIDKSIQPNCNFIRGHCANLLEGENKEIHPPYKDSSQQPSKHIEIEFSFPPKTESAFVLPSEVADHGLTFCELKQTSENPLDVEKNCQFQYSSEHRVPEPGNDLPKESQCLQRCHDSVQLSVNNNPISTDNNELMIQNPCPDSLKQSKNSDEGEFQPQHPCSDSLKQSKNSDEGKFQPQHPCQDLIQESSIKLLNTDKKEQASNTFQLPRPVASVKNLLPQYKSICIRGISYSVLSVLGKGGSSIVYQVLAPDTNKILAIKKVNLTGLDSLVADGYLNEVELLKSLQGCGHVIKMFASAEEIRNRKKLLYVVMEKGDTDFATLIRSINKVMRISFSTILSYWKEMLIAVQEIHKAGVIHSDLKPANFVLVHGKLKLIDFGIASKIHEDMTSVHKEFATGTWNYMSPEALRNTGCSSSGATCYKVTYRSDVWSMGCILYNLLYGCTPFQHIKNTMSKLQAIVDPKVKIDFPDKNVPPIFTNALKSCLQRDPKERATVDELLKEIESPFLFWDT